jgi:hypothetical protein
VFVIFFFLSFFFFGEVLTQGWAGALKSLYQPCVGYFQDRVS